MITFRMGRVAWAAGCLFCVVHAQAWTVVAPPDALDDVRFAAWDLENHLKRAAAGQDGVMFEIGTAAAKTKAQEAAGALANGESAAVSDGRTVWIFGEGKMGTANGVYAFLEKRLGCRWYTPYDDPVIPKRDLSRLGAFADVNRPKLTERWILTLEGHNQLKRNGMMFQYRNRLNANHWCRYNNVDTPKGMGTPVPEIRCVSPMVHSAFTWLPPKKYFAAHPDWYAMDKNGKRSDANQLCFATKEMRTELTKNFLAKVESEKGDGYFDFSQQDGQPFCQCPGCKALNEKYGTPGGAMFDFLKELGLALAKRHPKAYIHFLAYFKSQTETPPNEAFGRFPDNVIPVFAPIDDDFSKTYDHPRNAGTLANFKRWTKITKKRWVWYYPMPYYANNPPYSAIRRWTRDLKTLADAGLTGACFEHDVGVHSGDGFGDLQAWLMTKLYEDPSLEPMPLVQEFCRWNYGAGADEALQFLAELEDNTANYADFLRWQSVLPASIDERNLQRWAALFDRAAAKIGDDAVVRQHLNETRLGVDFWTLKRYAKIRRLGGALEPVDSIVCRMTNTLARGYARRCPGGAENAFAKTVKYNPQQACFEGRMRAVKGAAALAAAKGTPLPERFQGIPEADIVDLPNLGLDWGRKVQMQDACSGWATWHEMDSAPENYTVGFYDKYNKRFGEGRTIKPADVVAPDVFTFYRIGVETLSPSCYIYPGYSCHERVNLDEFCEPGVPQRWEAWISLKFEGPRYKGSKAKENRVYYDRVVLVRCVDAVELAADPQTFDAVLAKAFALRKTSTKPIRLTLAPGDYTVSRTFSFTPQTCGGGGAPLTICGDREKPRPRFLGSVPLAGWRREAFNGRGDVWAADAASLDFHGTRPELLFCDGARMDEARYPNRDPKRPYDGGWAYVPGKYSSMYRACSNDAPLVVKVAAEDWHDHAVPSEGRLNVFPRYNWWNCWASISNCVASNRTIVLTQPLREPTRPCDRYHTVGYREELDAPGEWHYDAQAKRFRFIPPAGVADPNAKPVTVPICSWTFSCSRVQDVTFEHLEIAAAQGGILLAGCTNVTVRGCAIHDVGTFRQGAVHVANGANCRVADCDVWNVGGNGASVAAGDNRLMFRAGHVVENCYFHHCGQINRHAFGINMSGLGITARHNLIHDMPRCGIFHGGRFNEISYNRVRHVNLEMEDTGAIYSCGSTTGTGCEIKYNHVSHSIGFGHVGERYGFGHTACGIYLDDGSGGYRVYGNLVHDCRHAGMHVHCGRFSVISNNVFVSNATADKREHRQFSITGWKSPGAFESQRKHMDPNWRCLVRQNPCWTNFPALRLHPVQMLLPDGHYLRGDEVVNNVFYSPDQTNTAYLTAWNFNPTANRVDCNLIFGATRVRATYMTNAVESLAAWQATGMDAHSIVADPLFVDPAKGDWRLRPESPAFKLGFKPLPLDEMGLVKSSYRRTLPKEAEGAREHPETFR